MLSLKQTAYGKNQRLGGFMICNAVRFGEWGRNGHKGERGRNTCVCGRERVSSGIDFFKDNTVDFPRSDIGHPYRISLYRFTTLVILNLNRCCVVAGLGK